MASPVKWMRKNNRKIMAIVVVLIMFAFIMPQVISQLARPAMGIKGSTAIGTFGVAGKVSNDDLTAARAELSILQALGAPDFLRSQPSIINKNSPDVPSMLLSQLLFPDPRLGPAIAEQVKKSAQSEELHITNSQIDSFFEAQGSEKPELMWFLLKSEAQNVGFAVSTEDAGRILKQLIPAMAQGKTDRQPQAEEVIKYIMDTYAVEQKTVLQAFADLLAVIQYSKSVTQNEDVTVDQLKYAVLQQVQTLDVNAVMLRAGEFTEKVGAPTAEQLSKQFEQFKAAAPREFSQANPFGFGYKQPDRIQFEWAMIDMSDVEKLIQKPTAEQIEEFYQRNLAQYKEQVKTDPNDPNSKTVEKTKSFADVAGQIERQLTQGRITDRADAILNEFRETADAAFAGKDIEALSPADLAKTAANYEKVAQLVGAKYNIKIYTSKSGFVSPEDLNMSELMARMFMPSQERTPTRLTKVLFAVRGLDAARLGPFDPVKPRLYESVGPTKDYSGSVSAVVRVTAFEKAAPAKSLDLKIAKKLPVMREGKIVDSNDSYVLAEKVTADVKTAEAFGLAQKAAQELEKNVASQGWNKAIAALNKELGSKDANDVKVKLQDLPGLRRVSQQDVLFTARRTADEPGQANMANMYQQQKLFLDRLFAFSEDVASGKAKTPQSFEDKSGALVFVVKSAKTSPVTKEMFEQIKPRVAFIEGYKQVQSLAIEFFRVDNILKRLNFKWDEKYKNAPVTQPQIPTDDVV